MLCISEKGNIVKVFFICKISFRTNVISNAFDVETLKSLVHQHEVAILMDNTFLKF